MYLLSAIILFIFDAVGAATKGDFSGTIFIGKVKIGIGLFFFVGIILIGFSTEGSWTIFIISIIMVALGVVLASKEY